MLEELLNLWVIPLVVGAIASLVATFIANKANKNPKSKIKIIIIIVSAILGIGITKIYFFAPPLVEVPRVLYRSQDEASLIIEQKKLTCSIIEEWNSKHQKYTVTSQDPNAGILVKKGSNVKLTVSKGESEDTNLKPLSKQKANILKSDTLSL